MIESPISRIGGKYFLSRWLVGKIPDHILYCEPFAGACHVLFAKPPSTSEVINDIDDNLVNFFRVVKDRDKRQRFTDIIDALPYARVVFDELSKAWRGGSYIGDDVERAAAWFFLNRSSFSNDINRGGFAAPSTTGRNPCQTFRNITDSLNEISKRLKYVIFEDLDYRECLNKYDSPDTFFYCDPPYLNTRDYYGKGCFNEEDHYRLAEILHNIKGQAMITHYKNNVYDGLYEGWQRYEYETFKASYGLTKSNPDDTTRPKVVEVLYCNFRLPEQKQIAFDMPLKTAINAPTFDLV